MVHRTTFYHSSPFPFRPAAGPLCSFNGQSSSIATIALPGNCAIARKSPVAEAIADIDEIREDSRLDRDLGDLAQQVRDLGAYEEGDRRLVRAAADTIDGWEDYDLDLFSEGLEDAIDRLDDLADRDCD